MMPSFTADYYGPKHVGANYGLLFSAWGLCGFIVPGYFAGIMDRARVAGDLAGGYREVYWKLALLAAVGAAVAALLRPRLEVGRAALRGLAVLLLVGHAEGAKDATGTWFVMQEIRVGSALTEFSAAAAPAARVLGSGYWKASVGRERERS